MLDDSLFASDGLIERPVMLGGKKTKLHFRELPATEFNACFLAGEGDRRVLSPAHLIAAAIIVAAAGGPLQDLYAGLMQGLDG